MSLMIGLEKIKFRYAVWLAYNRMVDEKSWLDCGCSTASDVGPIFFPVLLGYDLKEKADKMKRKND